MQIIISQNTGTEMQPILQEQQLELGGLTEDQRKEYVDRALGNYLSGVQLRFLPDDFNTLREGNIIPQEDFDYCSKFGKLMHVNVGWIDHNGIISLTGITSDEGGEHAVPLRHEDSVYGNPLKEKEFRRFLATSFSLPH